MNKQLKSFAQIAKWPMRRILSIPALRSRIIFELRQHYYSELECRLPLGHGLKCPVHFWEAWSSLGHIFFEDEYARAFSDIPLPRRWIDLGCYAGYFSLYLASLHARRESTTRGEALLIDADSRMAGAVRELIELNSLGGHWKFLHGAIAREFGRTQFVERPFMTSSLAGGKTGHEATLDVEVITPAQIFSLIPPPYDLIKIDIEGGEHDFLVAYGDVLAQTKYLLIEWHGWHPGGGGEKQIRRMVEDRGFSFVREVLAPGEHEHRSAERNSGVHLYFRKS